jgi:hypothetical protein
MVKSEQKLVAQIERAFADVPYPGDDRICEGVTAAHRQSPSEEARIAAEFRGRHWREVPLENLARYSATLCFLTPEAYRFYLPAYLRTVIGLSREDMQRVPRAGDLEQEILFSLTPATDIPYSTDHTHQRIDPLDREQKAAVRAFLHWIYRQRLRERGELFPGEQSVLTYWGYPEGHPSPSIQKVTDPLPPIIPGAKRSDSGECVVDGENCQLIQRLIGNRFVHVDQRGDGWTRLYHDPAGGDYWELTYPYPEMYGGGPPTLSRLSVEQVKALYRLPALEEQ